MSSNNSISTDMDSFGTVIQPPIGPPGWSQLVDVSWGNPYYVPNPYVICAGIWLLCCIFWTAWAAVTIRRNKGRTPITQTLAGWRYRLAMTLAIMAFTWAVFDDTYRLANHWVEQRLFLAQFIGDFFWDLAKIAVLLSVYHLYFHLMQQSPLGSGALCRMQFWRYKSAKLVFCSVLVLFSFLMMCLRIAYLSASVFHQTDTVENAAINLCLIFDSLYFVAGLELLVVGSVLLAQRKRKTGSGSTSMLSNNLITIALPLFLSATFTLINTILLAPPETAPDNSFGPTTAGGTTNISQSVSAVQFTAVLLGGIGVVIPLGGIVGVAKQADASMDRVQRLTSDSLDQVLVGSRRNNNNNNNNNNSEVNMEQTYVEGQPRPASSNYDDPESWGGSTRRPSYTV